jgi:phosphatidylethanolamine/phosphatidyl-N-methylethanolamine N-methyltransferase
MHVAEAYARWAPFYDATFAAVMRPGRKAIAAALNARGGKVLDVGVGTGLELPMFAAHLTLIGIDLSQPMLQRAQKRVTTQALHHVAGLCVMDALHLGFADNDFDTVIAPYVLSVVPDPAACLDEWLRVLKPGGELILVNHFGAEKGLMAAIEAWLGRHSASLGWRPQFPWAVLGDWLTARPRVQLLERKILPPLGTFTLTRLRKL